MIRVLHYVGAMNYGGVETLLINLYRNIDRTKVQFDFLVHNHSKAAFDDEIISLGGHIHKLTCTISQNPIKYLKELNDFFTQYKEYVIVHAHQNGLSGYILQIAKKHNVPVLIAHSHVVNPQYTLFQKVSRIIGLKLVRTNSDYILGCSSGAVEYLSGVVSDSVKNIVMKNAINIKNFEFNKFSRKIFRNQLGANDDTLVIGNVARFFDEKNHKYLIDLFNKFLHINPNSLLILIGDGELRKQIHMDVIERGIEDKVFFLGLRNNVNEIINAMDVFVMPSLFEGLGIVLIEAQANGLPCVASDTIPKDADIKSNLIRFVKLGNDNDWVNAIISAKRKFNLEDIRRNAIKAGYEIKDVAQWLQNFYINAMEKKMHEG